MSETRVHLRPGGTGRISKEYGTALARKRAQARGHAAAHQERDNAGARIKQAGCRRLCSLLGSGNFRLGSGTRIAPSPASAPERGRKRAEGRLGAGYRARAGDVEQGAGRVSPAEDHLPFPQPAAVGTAAAPVQQQLVIPPVCPATTQATPLCHCRYLCPVFSLFSLFLYPPPSPSPPPPPSPSLVSVSITFHPKLPPSLSLSLFPPLSVPRNKKN